MPGKRRISYPKEVAEYAKRVLPKATALHEALRRGYKEEIKGQLDLIVESDSQIGPLCAALEARMRMLEHDPAY